MRESDKMTADEWRELWRERKRNGAPGFGTWPDMCGIYAHLEEVFGLEWEWANAGAVNGAVPPPGEKGYALCLARAAYVHAWEEWCHRFGLDLYIGRDGRGRSFSTFFQVPAPDFPNELRPPWERQYDPPKNGAKAPAASVVLRWLIFKRDGYKCVDCGAGVDLTLDHVIPQSLGGITDEKNLETRCRSCNSSKGAMVRA